MKSGAVFSALAAFFLAVVQVQAVEAPIPGYGVQDFSWEIETTPGGSKVILNGTIQDVYTELLKINPRYDGDFAEYTAKNELAKRDNSASLLSKCHDVTCNNYQQAIRRRIKEGIRYLNSVPGQPTNGPGPGNCDQNTSPKTLPGFYNIAQGAQVVINKCDPTGIYVSGEENHADKWRALIRYNAC